MDIGGLTAEIAADPLGTGYAGKTNHELLESLKVKNRTIPVAGSYATELGVLKAFGAATGDPNEGEKCLAKLEKAAEGNAILERALGWIKPGAPGLDMGDPLIRAMLDTLVGAGVLTDTEAAILKALGEKTVSRLEELNSADMTLEDLNQIRKP